MGCGYKIPTNLSLDYRDKHERVAEMKHSIVKFCLYAKYQFTIIFLSCFRGQFAVVRRAKHKRTKDDFAAKFIRKRRAKASRRGVSLENIKREVAVLVQLNHTNIIKVYEIYENRQDVILILEL